MELHAPLPDETHLMNKEEETQSDNLTAKDLVVQVAETGTDTGIATSVKAISVAELADKLVNEETKGAELPDSLIVSRETAETVTKTAELAKEEPDNQPTVTFVPASLGSGTGDVPVNPNLEKEEEEAAANQTEQVKEEARETESPYLSVAANPISGTLEEDKGIELIKEIKEAEVSEAVPVAISDISPVAEITEDSRDAEPNHEEGSMATKLPHATPATETVNESAYLKPEAMLAEVKTEGPKLQDTLVAATTATTTAVENKDSELVNEEIKEFEFNGSLPGATPVVVTDPIPESKASETSAVTGVQIENEKATEELEVERTNVSPALAECEHAESEVTVVLPEKKKKRALGDHLAEEKANDSVSAIKSSSDEKSKVELSQMEQIASAVALTGSADVSRRDVNTNGDTKTEADEKDEDQKAVDNAESEVTGTKVEVTKEEGENAAEKESVAAGQEEVASKTTPRSSNNILSKVKHQIVKVKKAIVRRSPSSKNMPMENKDDIKVK